METPPRTWGRPHRLVDQRLAIMKHPHARGEDVREQTRERVRRETPPRTWGRHGREIKATPEKRNTPTHVGKTTS